MTQEPDEDELAPLRDRQHAARCLMCVAYDRLDLIAEEVEAITGEGRIATRPDLLIALSEAEHTARIASADMKDAEYALAVAMGALTVRQRTGESAA
ncbi:hypothetical protein ACQKJ1_25065 [Methylorubrum rhodesianum]|uniref:hypothetical protein n=1 Tax=Methylorubrum rhodesianum TaxID=29427 RepID=UPI003D062D4A